MKSLRFLREVCGPTPWKDLLIGVVAILVVLAVLWGGFLGGVYLFVKSVRDEPGVVLTK